MAKHAEMQKSGVAIYFCDPHIGSAVLDCRLPKGTDLSVHSGTTEIAYLMNILPA